MCMRVDLPEPGGAHDGDELAGLDRQRDAARACTAVVALAVAAGEVAGHDDGAGAGRGGAGIGAVGVR